MSKILNPSKLLPSSKSSIIKSSTIAKIRKPNILAKTSSLSKGLLATRQSKDVSDVNNKLVKIDKFLKSDLIISQKKAEVKRKGKEKQDFDEAEKKLETPKLKGFKIPSLGLPSLGFFDRVKRFLFFTALGWLLPKIIEFLPKLEGFVKIVGGIYNFAEGLFGNLFNGFMSLVKFGGDLKNKTLGFIASAKAGVGGNYQKEFEKLEKQFNTFANVSIIAGLVGLDMGLAGLDEFNKQKKKGQKPVAGKPKPGGKPKVTTGKGGEKPSGKPKVTTGKGGKSSSWMDKILKGPFAKLKGPLSRFAGAAVPGLGAVVGAADAKARFAVGDKIGGALASVSAALDAATVASALTGVGIPVAGILGSISIGIDVILLIRDILSLIPFIPKNLLGFSRGGKVVKRYQGGGTTRGGRPVGGPRRRAITPTRKKPPRVTIPKTQPGKDVGGEKKVKEFYAKPEDPNKRYTRPAGGWLSNLGKERQDLSAFDTLKKMSGTLKSDETLAKGILGVMSSGIDMALGQKPDKKVFKSFFDSIGYIADTLASQRASKSMSSLRSQIGAFAEGGTIPSRGLRGTYIDANTGDMLAKLIGPTIDQRVNEAIQSIEKQLQMKGAGGAGAKPDAKPGADGDAPGARLRDGSNAQIEADLLEYFTAIYGKNAAIGIVANIRRESGYRTATPDNPRFEGMVQWSRNDRWPKFVKWAESKGLDPYNRNAQAQYIVIELKQLGTDKRLKNAKTSEEAASLFYNEFERAAYSKPVVGARNYDSNNPHERKNKEFIQDISGRNPDIGKRADQVLIAPTTSASGVPQGQSKVSQDIADFRKFRTQFGGQINRNPTYDPNYYQIREMGVYGSGNYQISPLADDTNYEINVHKGAGHWENRAFDIPVPSNSKEGDAVAQYWRSKGYTVLWRVSGHYDHVHVEAPKDKASEWFKINKNAGTLAMKDGKEGIMENRVWKPKTWTAEEKERYQKTKQVKTPTTTPTTPTKPQVAGGGMGGKRGSGTTPQMQGGGLIGPSKPNRSIPNSFAPYETPGGGMMIAIQPMIIERQVPVSGGRGKMIAFPVLVAGVNNNTNLSNLSQG